MVPHESDPSYLHPRVLEDGNDIQMSLQIGITKIHAQFHIWILERSPVVVGDVDSVAQKRLIHRFPKIVEQHEVQMMDVERVQLIRSVLNGPVFYSSLPGDNIGYIRLRIERCRLLALHREVELRTTVGIVRSE
jgi:hypothetical protein